MAPKGDERLFVCYNPAVPIPPHKDQPKFTISAFFRHAIEVSKSAIFLTKTFWGDKQTISC